MYFESVSKRITTETDFMENGNLVQSGENFLFLDNLPLPPICH